MLEVPSEYLGPYITSNVIVAALLVAAWFWPKITRYLFALMFLAASIANTTAVLRDAPSYLEYRQFALLQVYRDFIDGFFSRHIVTIVVTIAFGQLCVAVLLAAGRRPGLVGALGASIFFLCITPLGIGGGFPFQLLALAAVSLMVWRESTLTETATAPAA